MLVLYGRLTFQPACVFRGLNKGLKLCVTYVCTCMIRVCEPWLHTRLNTVYACIHLDLALPPRTRPRHGAPPEGEGPARRLQGAGGESGTPTRTAPTARTTSSTWPSRARAASCEARGSEGGRAQRGCGCTRYRGGGVSGLYAHTIHGSVGGCVHTCDMHMHMHMSHAHVTCT